MIESDATVETSEENHCSEEEFLACKLKASKKKNLIFLLETEDAEDESASDFTSI